MADIARELGISRAAVSFALNGNPGVAEDTRERVLRLATEIGWRASASARALRGSPVKVVGLALARPTQSVAAESSFIGFLAGVESLLAERGWSLLLRLLGDDLDREIETYRTWWGEGRIDAVILMNERFRDPRLPAIEQLGLPAMLCGGRTRGYSIPCLWIDQRADAALLVDHLAGLGHRRIAYLGGPQEYVHERGRSQGMRAAARRHGIDLTTISVGHEPRCSAQASVQMYRQQDHPTAIVYGNDSMAVSGIKELEGQGVRVPEQIALCAWEDSELTRVTQITALERDNEALGRGAGRMVLDRVEGVAVVSQKVPASRLRIRASTQPVATNKRP